MNKVTEMLIRERDGVQSAISRGKFVAPQNGAVRTTPRNASDTLKQLDYLVGEAKKLDAQSA